MKVNSSIFKSYDIRGIYPNDINKEVAYKIGKGFATFLINSLKKREIIVSLGQDMRLSSPILKKEFKRGLINSGINVVDIGLVSTPTLYFSVFNYNYDAGVQITASHNPKEYNGFKLVKNSENGIIKIGKNSGMNILEDIVLKERFIKTNKKGKSIINKKVLNDEINKLIEFIDYKKIKKLKIVADAANAMLGIDLDALFKKLPVKLIKMNFKLDGRFPKHEANPLKFETLKDLQKKVIKEKADLGIAPDGDGDRVFFIDEKGKIIPASHITALLSKELLRMFPKEKIAFDIRYIFTPKEIVLKEKGFPIITPVGHALISEKMREKNALFAGESSGHYFFRQTGFAESSLLVILLVLEIISRENKPISKILKPLISSFESGEINFELKDKKLIKNKFKILKEHYKNGKISLLDGLSIEYPDWRFNLRASNTEPLLRLNLEAKSKKILKEKQKEVLSLLNSN
ncbi:MAG TPA: phosphomannomutase/phosphoglucomutase [Candidatus Pacearchaeota archaeon]|nr:phosphomannomutase/phosphoglucomutase [Candidatus Pacearchaeota archaeon]